MMKPGKGRDASERNITKGRIQPDATRPAPPVYRPQPTPKVLQRKVVTTAQGHPPVAQSKFEPAPPRVLQAKRSAVQSPGHCAATTIQRSRNPITVTTATANFTNANNQNVTETGRSGNQAKVELLLTQKITDAKKKFAAILASVPAVEGRTPYMCAEPYAVALLLNNPKGPKSESDLWNVFVTGVHDGRGPKSECRVCGKWLDKGKIDDPTAESGVPRNDEGRQPAGFKLMDSMPALPAAPPPPAPKAWLNNERKLFWQQPAAPAGSPAPATPASAPGAPAAAVPKAPAGAWVKRLGDPRQ